jgi:hypothetical protein
MAYRELKRYQSYVLEIREWGDTGWAVHAYAPKVGGVVRKVAMVSSHRPNDLTVIMRQAQAAVDQDIAAPPHR